MYNVEVVFRRVGYITTLGLAYFIICTPAVYQNPYILSILYIFRYTLKPKFYIKDYYYRFKF